MTTKLAEIAGDMAELLYAPNMVSSPELRQSLISEPAIADALERARRCDIILQIQKDVLAALQGGYFNVLITDTDNAAYLLNHDQHRKGD